ncbi:hypothetical protein NBRC110019_27680 [Neptunitalea chrysea]|uniref:Thioredoxin domain-containing protein n=2 Tax=Neptunitalea chrysea TaxID=1647581 RepID=A0A9W6B8Q0_9FLAO|nr:hypothetical protein NBRC110019_27680 [Neptunitalea chrysea]
MVLVVTVFCSCGAKNSAANASEPEKPQLYTDSKVEFELGELVGAISKSQLSKSFNWFRDGYGEYVVDTTTMSQVKPYLEGVQVKLFMGTWCSDSQREVPHFFKIMDAVNFHDIEIIGVDESKTTPQGTEKLYDVINVPTFIFLKDGQEINRMVEFPWDTLEKDMLAIFTTTDYKNPYAE